MQRWHAAIWSDGSWAWREHVEEMTHLSDDYIRVALPEWMGQDDMEFFANMVQNGWTQQDIDLAIARDIDGPTATLPTNWKPNNFV